MSDASYLRGVEVEGSICGYRRKGLVDKRKAPGGYALSFATEFRATGVVCKTGVWVAFESFVEDFPDFVGTARKRMKTFSTGERRMIEVYAVLASDSKFCLLDEPFSFMMPLHVQKMKEVIRREKKRKGIVITDHYFEDVIDISDELFMLRSGKTWRVNGREDLELLGYIRNADGIQDR